MKQKTKTTPTMEQRQAADPLRSVWVAANAGSGKTQVLVDRVIRLLLEGADPQTILCLTYTKAAAAEMSNRLFERLSDWIGLDDVTLDDEILRLSGTPATPQLRTMARTLFARALETPGGLKIQTIHAFCERLLQLFPVESGMAPGFRVLEDQERKQLFRDALLEALSGSAYKQWDFISDTGINTLEALEELTKAFLGGATGMRQRLSDADAIYTIKPQLLKVLNVSDGTSIDDIKADMCDIDEQAYAEAIAGLMPLEADAKPSTPKLLSRALAAATIEDRISAFADLLITTENTPRKKLIRVNARKAQPVLAEWLDSEADRLNALFKTLALQEIYAANLALYSAMSFVLTQVNVEKSARGLYDFDDLIAKTANLLDGRDSVQWVHYKLDKGLTHILVDEAQDTSPTQWRIIKALAGEFFTDLEKHTYQPRTIFVVGDIKQSIFSFQGADIASFEAARLTFNTDLNAVGDSLRKVELAISYRSTPEVLASVDRVFARGLARSGFGSQASSDDVHTAYHAKRLGLVELWDVIRPDDKAEPNHWQAPVDKPTNTHHRLKLAERLASTIASWINTRKLSGEDRPVAAGDILILLQKRNDLFHALIGALRRKGVDVAGADRLVLQNSLIVKDLIALGQFMRMPSDDLNLASLLKSPLVPEALNEEQIFAIAHDRGIATVWQRLPNQSANQVMLENCLANTSTPYMFFASVLQNAKSRILERLGAEADDAAQEFLTLALDYEQRYGTSLAGFLDWFAEGETEIKREMEKGSGKLRIMTVHGAKGLESPIVILADAADDPPKSRSKSLRITREGPERGLHIFLPKTQMKTDVIETLKQEEKAQGIQEKMRLMYVAMTRAADELYICGSHNDRNVSEESWYHNIREALLEDESMRVVNDDPELRIWRWGAEPQLAQKQTGAVPVPIGLPDWLSTSVPTAHRSTLPLQASRNSDAFDRAAIAAGIATHKLLEMMADVAVENRLAAGLRWAKRLQLPDDLVPHLSDALQNTELRPLFGPDGQSEVSIEGKVEGIGRVSGRLDRLAITADTIYLLDYKTNRVPPSALGAQHHYIRQMARYVALLSAAYPGLAVKAALLWTQTGRVMWLNPALLSQSLDEQRLSQALTPAPMITTS